MRNVDEAADEIGERRFEALPERVQEALGELAGAAKEGLLALSVGVGLGVLRELMAEEVDDVCVGHVVEIGGVSPVLGP
jgi:putative transposase